MLPDRVDERTPADHDARLRPPEELVAAERHQVGTGRQAVEKAGQYAYRDRKVKKRTFRALWIQRINAAARENGITYGQLIDGLKKAGIDLDRKVLADIAVKEPAVFATLVKQAQSALG